MLKSAFIIYNQTLEKLTWASCSLYVWAHIFQIQYWITIENKVLVAATKKAKEDKVLFSWGAYADTISKWVKKTIYDTYKIELDLITISWYSKQFETMLKNWNAFWIGLKFAGRFYRDMNEDLIITTKEITRDTSTHTVIWHFLTYFYSPTAKKYYILDSLWKNRKPIEMDIEVFRKWIDNKVFFINCRTMTIKDQRLDYWLRFFKRRWTIKNVESLSKEDRVAHDRSLKLRVFKK